MRRSPVFRPLRQRLGVELYDLVDAKLVVRDATLTESLCGFSPAEAGRLMADVDVVVHFAGLTDFEPDPTQAVAANVYGATHVADLAALSPDARYVHCSTCFVAGEADGEVTEGLTPGVSPNGTSFDPATLLADFEDELSGIEAKQARIDHGMARARELGWPNI